MTGFTWSSRRTMSPMTTVCSPVFLKAAHEVSPIDGVNLTPATVTAKSLRGSETLNTPSLELNVPFAPVSSSMRVVSRDVLIAAMTLCAVESVKRPIRMIRIRARFIESSPFGPTARVPAPTHILPFLPRGDTAFLLR